MDEDQEMIANIFKNELVKFIKSLNDDEYDLDDLLSRKYELNFSNKNSTCICDDKCQGDLCKKHSNKLLYGLITDSIPREYENKFTKRLKPINTTESNININLSDDNSSETKKNDLIEKNIQGYNYLLDSKNDLIYTNDRNTPKYIGKLVGSYIVRY